MRDDPAVVFFHRNPSWYLPYVLLQAKQASPNSRIVLLGDGADIQDVEKVPCDRFEEAVGAREFRKLYRYMSGNSYDYELYCYLRWFFLLEYMKESGLDSAIYLDSDCLLYSTAREIVEWLGDCDCAYSIESQGDDSKYWCGSGHASYWTREALEDFCDFILRSYSDESYLSAYEGKWRADVKGGVSDMTSLYFFWRMNKRRIGNTSVCHAATTVDHNINLTSNYEESEYKRSFGKKKVVFNSDRPYLVKRASGERVAAMVLHCQGGAKIYIPLFYRGQDFEGRRDSDDYTRRQRIEIYLLYAPRLIGGPIKRRIRHRFRSLFAKR